MQMTNNEVMKWYQGVSNRDLPIVSRRNHLLRLNLNRLLPRWKFLREILVVFEKSCKLRKGHLKMFRKLTFTLLISVINFLQLEEVVSFLW